MSYAQVVSCITKLLIFFTFFCNLIVIYENPVWPKCSAHANYLCLLNLTDRARFTNINFDKVFCLIYYMAFN